MIKTSIELDAKVAPKLKGIWQNAEVTPEDILKDIRVMYRIKILEEMREMREKGDFDIGKFIEEFSEMVSKEDVETFIKKYFNKIDQESINEIANDLEITESPYLIFEQVDDKTHRMAMLDSDDALEEEIPVFTRKHEKHQFLIMSNKEEAENEDELNSRLIDYEFNQKGKLFLRIFLLASDEHFDIIQKFHPVEFNRVLYTEEESILLTDTRKQKFSIFI